MVFENRNAFCTFGSNTAKTQGIFIGNTERTLSVAFVCFQGKST